MFMSYLDERRKHIEDGRPLPPKKKYTIPKKSDKRIQKEKEQKVEIVNQKKRPKGWFDAYKVYDSTDNLQKWFEDRRKEMTGVCVNCGGKSCKDDDKYWKYSIAHLLPKNHFKSISTNENNWLELCHFGNSCHANYDNKMLDIMDMSCFDTIIQKFVKIYPHIAQEEKRRIPPILIEYLKIEI
jgi:hypothetical protein